MMGIGTALQFVNNPCSWSEITRWRDAGWFFAGTSLVKKKTVVDVRGSVARCISCRGVRGGDFAAGCN